ncbi:hypothetical protein NOF55_02830 [Rhizobiaceae bacterium BDR2-2]|uniref:Uncharacterized protein n=1 Tax=Ectorhizobium quercum TaxID=2965071 RepID=A0AAE3MYK2_9HYPH|nr:hypothetical protein [Ectorhizobium quercum]MCX8996030.1 hypothetical protein [Ectorhizobium quercum]
MATLKVDGETRYHRPDILLFFILPLLMAVIASALGASIDRDTFNVSISVFAIFSALLLNVQIALFGISQREWKYEGDELSDDLKKKKLEERRELLGELNTNISYLIVVSCLAVTAFLIFYVMKQTSSIETLISIWLYAHFFLTLLMVIKRAHALFQKEYEIT